MAQALQSTVPVKPANACVTTLTVVKSMRLSNSFIRVTLTNCDPQFAETFRYLGGDQWFRLFLPGACGTLELPFGGAEGWYARHLAMPQEVRPVVRNYTICAARKTAAGWEFEVDFVIHKSANGVLDGVAANWAVSAVPGDVVGFLDQGGLFNPGEHHGPVLIIADESGLPGVEGIARTLPAGTDVKYLLEVPTQGDIRVLAGDGDVHWLPRTEGSKFGSRISEALENISVPATSYAYVVGEGGFVLKTRATLMKGGIPKNRLHFCAYWRPIPRPHLES